MHLPACPRGEVVWRDRMRWVDRFGLGRAKRARSFLLWCGFPCLLCLVSLCRTCGSNYEYTLPKHVAVRPCGTDRHELRHGSGGRSSDGQPSRLFDESNTNDARPTHEPGPSFPRSWSNGRRLWAFVQLPARYPKRATSRAQLVPASVRTTPLRRGPRC